MVDKKKIGGLIAFVVSMLIGVFVINPAINKQPDAPVAPSDVSTVAPAVAGASTKNATPPPAAKAVVVSGPDTKPVTVASAPRPASPRTPTPPPQAPTIPPPADTPPPPPPAEQPPETIEVNIKGPLTFTLSPGQRSQTLSYEILDHIQYGWKPGLATIWQNEVRNPEYPVWSTILVNKTNAPYVSDKIEFVLEADPATRPGHYEVKMILIIREGIELEIPVVVTVLDPAQQHSLPEGPSVDGALPSSPTPFQRTVVVSE